MTKSNFSSLCFFSIFIFLNCQQIYSQSSFEPGYIVNKQKDTISGFIKNQNDILSAQKCILKTDINSDKSSTYYPINIESYNITNRKKYTSGRNLKNDIIKSDLFIENVLEGVINIYYYKTRQEEHFYVQKDTIFIELLHSINNTKSNKYKGQLRLLMNDQPALFNKINKISCNKIDLAELAIEYQKLCCPDESIEQFNKNKIKDIVTRFGIVAALGSSSLKESPYFMGRSVDDISYNLNVEPITVYEFGGLINFYLNFMAENKAILQLSPTINFSNYSSNKERTVSQFVYKHKANFKFTTLKIPMSFKYRFYSNQSSIFPYLKLGITYLYHISHEGSFDYSSILVNGNPNSETSLTDDLTISKRSHIMFNAGAGIDFNIGKELLFLGLNIETGNFNYQTTRTDIMFQFGIQF